MARPARLWSGGREVEARMWQTANASDASRKARHGALALFGSRGYPDRGGASRLLSTIPPHRPEYLTALHGLLHGNQALPLGLCALRDHLDVFADLRSFNLTLASLGQHLCVVEQEPLHGGVHALDGPLELLNVCPQLHDHVHEASVYITKSVNSLHTTSAGVDSYCLLLQDQRLRGLGRRLAYQLRQRMWQRAGAWS